MSAPRHFRRPLFSLGKKRDREEWMDRFARFAARVGSRKRGKPRPRDDGQKKLPPGSGMPSDPPPPPAPGLSGGAAAPLEYGD